MTDENLNKKPDNGLEYASEITEQVPSVGDPEFKVPYEYGSFDKPNKKRRGALTFAIVMSTAFILALSALLLVLFKSPSTPETAAELTYTEIYAKCAPFTVSVQTPGGSVGSGFFITESGRIVTNYHVVESEKTVTVHTFGGKTYPGNVITYDKDNDIAVIDIVRTSNEIFPYASFADSSAVKTGDNVIAIGSPEKIALGWTMTVGYVSCAERKEMSSGSEKSFIQFDAAVNPGNSGGPLINTKGEVIGVIQSKAAGANFVYDAQGNIIGYTDSYFEGLGFAIPANTASSVVNNLIKNLSSGDKPDEEQSDEETPKVQLGIVGISIYKDQEYFVTDEALFIVSTNAETKEKYIKKDSETIILTEDVLKSGTLLTPKNDGILVIEVVESSGAYGKILKHDVLFKLDGVLINRYNSVIYTGNYEFFDLVYQLLLPHNEGDKISVSVERYGITVEETVTLVKKQ